jgi:predicted nucleic acid-binding protein
VKVYIDTNIVVADAIKQHEHHPMAAELFRTIALRRWTPVMSAHGMAEIYSVMTRAPYQPRVTPAGAWHALQENVLASFDIEALTKSEYIRLIKECAAQGWAGGIVYDAIHVYIARKTQCSRIYTLDVSHFRRLAPDLSDRIMAP